MISDLVDVELELHHETDRAYLVWDGTEHLGEPVKQWIPKSKVEIERSSDSIVHTFTMPEWLALEKDFI